MQKYFHSFFGSNENFKICFWDLLTFIMVEDGLLILYYFLDERVAESDASNAHDFTEQTKMC